MTGSAANMEAASSGVVRQSAPPKVTCTTCWPAPKQSKTSQPGKPSGRSRSWISQRKSASRWGQGRPAGLSIAKSADRANAGATQHSPAHREQSARRCARAFGSEDVKTRVRELTQGKGADVVYDPVGGDVFDRSRKCIAFEGRLVVVGFTSGRIPEAPANHVLVKNYSVVGLHWGLYRKHDPALFGQVHEQLCRLFAEGAIAPLIGQTLPLAELPRAVAAIADRGTVGKVVLKP